MSETFFLDEKEVHGSPSIVDFFPVYTSKTESGIQATGIVAYSVHAVSVNV